MGKRTSRFRSLTGAALIAILVCGLTVPAAADAPLRPYSVVVDGSAARAVSGFSDGFHLMLALEDLARALHHRMTREGSTRIVHVADESYAFTPGDSDISLDGTPVAQAAALPVERDGRLYVALTDLQDVLSQEMTLSGTRVDIATAQAPTGVHTAPLARPRISSYIVSTDSGSGAPPQVKRPGQRFTGDATNALIIHVSTSDFGGSKSRDLAFTTDGTRLRGDLDLSAFDNSNPALSGQVTVGTRERYVQGGYEPNPVNGLIFSAPGGTGVSVRRDSITYGSEHDAMGRTLLALRRDRDTGASFLAVVRSQGTMTPVWGDRSSTDGIVKVTREIWVSDRGAAGSISVATQGRLFGEAVASGVLGTFPLQTGEAPERLNLGFRANGHVTMRAGLTSGYQLRASPYVALSMFGNHGITGSLQFAGGDRSASLSYAGLQTSLTGAYSVAPGGGATWALNGSLTAHRRLFDLSAFHSQTSEDDVIRTHTLSGPGIILGIERIVNAGHSRIGPVIGLSVPVGSSSSFEMTDHPTGGGRTIGFGFSQRISFAPRVRMRTIRIENASAAQLYIDDRLTRRIDGTVTNISIEPGSHRIQARTQDGTAMSLPASVENDSASVDLTLLPVRSIAGRIVQTDADPAGRKISLEHISVRLEPGDILAETAADGSFEIPAGPVAPNARISIQKESLPDGLTVGDDVPADAIPLVLSVKTRVKVHRKKF